MMSKKLEPEELGAVNGGKNTETAKLIFLLGTHGYGRFVSLDGKGTIDYEGLKNLFASKGYRFVPSEDNPNLFIDQEGLTYGQDYINYLIENEIF